MPREMPNSKRLEQSLLGSLMVYPDVYSVCQDYDLSPREFFVPSHQKIYQAMEELAEKGQALYAENVIERLNDKEELEAAGGLEYLMALMDGAISSANAQYYAETIKNKAQLRTLIEAAEKISSTAMETTSDIDEVLDSAERDIMDVTRHRRGSEFESSSTIVSRVLEELKFLQTQKGVTGIKTGFTALDSMTNGFQRGDLIILAARPAMGKSALALNFVNQVAKRNEGCVAVFSLEMPSDSLIKRLMSCESQVFADKLRSGKVTNDEMSRLYEAGNRLSERNIFIDDTSSIRVSQIFSKCRKLKSEYKSLSLVVIDYLQLISGSGRSDSRQQEVSEISRNLKILAKEMECPVIALSQLSRKVEERTDHEPQLSDLRESGSIEQDADIVMFLYREDYYNKEADGDKPIEVIDLSLAKHRNGSIGKINLAFEKNISRFSNCRTDMEDPYAG
ncbi:MAG: replicative DNA helicase [Erysipelotrichaceae bacterium]|nr:replicative DNA helicase [Erysipelotrichaceae bacterium]